MRAEALRDLLARLNECTAAPSAKAEFRKMIEAVGRAHGVSMVSPADRIAFARRLLDAGVARTEIRDRLMARFEVRESQAYRDIGAALQIVPNATVLWDSTQA